MTEVSWTDISLAPMDGTEVLLWDGFGVVQGAFDAPTSFEDFLEFCDDDEGEEEWREYLRENPGMGWVARDPITGDLMFLDPVAFAEVPSPPKGFGSASRRVVMSAGMAGEA